MLVILTDNQIFAPEQVCQSCLLADGSGQPRWRGGKLHCAVNPVGVEVNSIAVMPSANSQNSNQPSMSV